MAEACDSCNRSETQKSLTVNEDDLVAAHQHLSDEDNKKHKKKRERSTDEQDVDGTRSLSDATSAKIHEIFGNDEVFHPKKQKKYRSLESIYMTTRPIVVEEAENGIKAKI